MATAKIVGEPKIVIELSMYEARVLRTVLDSVGGPSAFARGRMDDLLNALEGAGVGIDDELEIEGSVMLEMSRKSY
jgi:hypothetical protein